MDPHLLLCILNEKVKWWIIKYFSKLKKESRSKLLINLFICYLVPSRDSWPGPRVSYIARVARINLFLFSFVCLTAIYSVSSFPNKQASLLSSSSSTSSSPSSSSSSSLPNLWETSLCLSVSYSFCSLLQLLLLWRVLLLPLKTCWSFLASVLRWARNLATKSTRSNSSG